MPNRQGCASWPWPLGLRHRLAEEERFFPLSALFFIPLFRSSRFGSIADGVATDSMKSRLLELESEKEKLAEELKAMASAENIVEFHPAAVDAYRKKVSELQSALGSDERERREAANIIRSLVTGIEIIPREGRGQVELRVHGALAELLNLPNRRPGELPRTVLVVAEVRYRQPPHLPDIRYRLRLFSRNLAA